MITIKYIQMNQISALNNSWEIYMPLDKKIHNLADIAFVYL